ncbi:hypothetical protein TWF694_008346 [Orbilia ellipsospora]|uniref:Uncharacterized protein n=1 Tax=Orbilia ellipsospora TaxID=2528407 RepID=A0AAV9XFT5_9PEZI
MENDVLKRYLSEEDLGFDIATPAEPKFDHQDLRIYPSSRDSKLPNIAKYQEERDLDWNMNSNNQPASLGYPLDDILQDDTTINREKCRPLNSSQIARLTEEELAIYLSQPIGFPNSSYTRQMVQPRGKAIQWTPEDSRLFHKWAFDTSWNGLISKDFADAYEEFMDLVDEELGSTHNMTADEASQFKGKITTHVRAWVKRCLKNKTAAEKAVRESNGEVKMKFQFLTDHVPTFQGNACPEVGSRMFQKDRSHGTGSESDLQESDQDLVSQLLASMVNLRKRSFALLVKTTSEFIAKEAEEELLQQHEPKRPRPSLTVDLSGSSPI